MNKFETTYGTASLIFNSFLWNHRATKLTNQSQILNVLLVIIPIMRLRHTHPHIRTMFHSIKEQNIYITTADWTRLCLLRSSDRMWRSRLLFLLVWYGQYGQLNRGSLPHSYIVWRLSVGLWRYALPHLLQWNLLIEGDNSGCTLPSSRSSTINHDGGLLLQEVQSSSCSTDAEKTRECQTLETNVTVDNKHKW